jgi:hypothetical protein
MPSQKGAAAISRYVASLAALSPRRSRCVANAARQPAPLAIGARTLLETHWSLVGAIIAVEASHVPENRRTYWAARFAIWRVYQAIMCANSTLSGFA